MDGGAPVDGVPGTPVVAGLPGEDLPALDLRPEDEGVHRALDVTATTCAGRLCGSVILSAALIQGETAAELVGALEMNNILIDCYFTTQGAKNDSKPRIYIF